MLEFYREEGPPVVTFQSVGRGEGATSESLAPDVGAGDVCALGTGLALAATSCAAAAIALASASAARNCAQEMQGGVHLV